MDFDDLYKPGDLKFDHITEPIKWLTSSIINRAAPPYMLIAIVDETTKKLKHDEILDLRKEMLEYLKHFQHGNPMVSVMIKYFSDLQYCEHW